MIDVDYLTVALSRSASIMGRALANPPPVTVTVQCHGECVTDAATRRKARDLAQLLEYQHQVISRRQALLHGLTDQAIYQRSRTGGRWQRLLPSVFLTVTGTPTLDQQAIAACLYAGDGGTLTCGTALGRHGLRDPSPASVHVLIPARRKLRSTGFVVVHRTWRPPALVCYEGPIQFALPARAVADAAREMSSMRSVRATVASAVQSGRSTVEQLQEELRTGPVGGSALFRAALAEVARGAWSAPEAELMALIGRSGLPEPLFNPRLLCGQKYLARPDAWWPEHGVAVEVDSKEWHLSPHDWEQTMRRRATMTALGILVLNFTPRQIRHEPKMVISTIRVALESRRGSPRPNIQAVPGSAAR